MRDAFIHEFRSQAAGRQDLFLIVGDLGYRVVESFAADYPDRFLNAGVAEQNMTGVAAGLSQTGFNVFTYSIANFPTLRCLEQIRNDVCYHRANVKIVSVGAGLAYGSLGYSHHAVQDLACLRTLPGMLMATPCDPLETKAVTAFLAGYEGPAYLRLGKAREPTVHARPVQIAYPCFPVIREGNAAAAILACGSAAAVALKADPDSAVYSAALWSDDDATRNAVVEIVRRHRRLVVVEEHLRAGGFGSFVRECLEPWPDLQHRVRSLAIDAAACGTVGSQAYLRSRGGLVPQAIHRAMVA